MNKRIDGEEKKAKKAKDEDGLTHTEEKEE